MFTDEQIAELSAPLSRAHVKGRTQGGMKLSYIEAWHAIAEANRIFGFGNWDRETVLLQETNRELVELRSNQGPYKQWRVGYLAKVRIRVGDCVREGTGFGSGMSKPEALGEAIESAAKEAESDAMKRALMTFGNPFGLALYDKKQENVANPEPEAGPELKAPSIHPEGPDWWRCEGPGMTANAAKKEGLGERFEELREEIARLSTSEEWRRWCNDKTEFVARLPKSWRVMLRQEAEEMGRELGIDFNSKRAA